MAIANLNNAAEVLDTGKDSIVIVDNFQSIRGGRTLDVTGFTPTIIKAGHVIIQSTSTGQYKPMPVNGLNSIGTFGSITGGSSYTNGTYTNVALTGGSGTGATANITVSGGAVTAVNINVRGANYVAGDVLSALAANIGGTGSGFSVPVATVNPDYVYQSLPASHTYAGILVCSILTAKPFAGIMVRGTLNPVAAPGGFSTIAAAFKTAMPLIDQRAD